MSTDAMIVIGVAVAVVSAIAISFFQTKSTESQADSNLNETSQHPTLVEMLSQIEKDLKRIEEELSKKADKV
jgi:hypothetical protein